MAGRRREAATGSSAEGEERFGARWNGLTNESLVAPPVRHHGPGSDRRQGDGARNTRSFGRFTSPPPKKRPASSGASKSARSPRSVNHCAERCFGHRPATPSRDGARVLHDTRGNTFRFVVCSNSIQSAMALQLPASNLRWQPHDEQSSGGGESRARSGRRQPARRTTGRLVLSNVSNRGGGSIEVVW